jgi:uncharacterized protein HemX
MPDGRPLMPRIRMPRISRPGRASRADTDEKTAAVPTAETKQEPATPATETKAGNGAEPATKPDTTPTPSTTPTATPTPAPTPGAKPDATKPDPAKPGAAKPETTGEPNLQERVEGLQGWAADLERKQARLTYFGGLALLLALGAAGAALYFGLTAHSDSATKSDLDALTKRVDSLQGAVTKNSKDTQNALNASIAQLQQSITGLQKQQSTAQSTISALQSQVQAAALNKNAAPTVTPTTPTTTTTPGGTGK